MSDINGEEFTIIQLKEWLRELGLSTVGNKVALIERLNSVQENDRGVCPTSKNSATEQSDVLERDAASGDSNESYINREFELLRRELALSKKEKELLQRENDLLKKQINCETTNVAAIQEENSVNFANIKDFIPEYDGNTNVGLWIAQLENLQKKFSLKDDIVKSILICKLKGSAQAWMYSKSDYVTVDVNILVNEMRNAFQTQTSKMMQRRKFENRKWLSSESFTEYVSDKKILSTGIQIEEDEMVEYLIEGIGNFQLRNQATMQNFTNIDDLIRAFSKIQLPKISKPTMNGATDVQLSNKNVRCYNCNSLGHFAKDCKKPKREIGACYGCGSKDHLLPLCPQRKGVHVVESDDYVRLINFSFNSNSNSTYCFSTLIDSGSPISFLRRSTLKCVHNFNFIPCKENENVYFGLNKTMLSVFGQLTCYIIIKENKKVLLNLLVVADKSISVDVVLGRDYLRKTGSRIISEDELQEIKNQSKVNKKDCGIQVSLDIPEKLLIFSDKDTKQQNEVSYLDDNSSKEILMIDYELESQYDLIIGNEISYENKMKLISLFKNNYILSKKPLEPKVKFEMKLILNSDKRFSCPPRRISYSEKQELQKVLDIGMYIHAYDCFGIYCCVHIECDAVQYV